MTYDILIGDRSYSSWSLRGWLLFAAFDIPVRVEVNDMYRPEFAQLAKTWGGRTVPIAKADDGSIWTDSIAIAEGLAERHPDAGFWPDAPPARAMARSMVADMHSGFTALRGACPMNLRVKWEGFAPSEDVLSDLARLEAIWAKARTHAGDGPWLFGRYGAVDAFFAPVAVRIAGYGLPASPEAEAYVRAHLNHAPLIEWRDAGEARDRTLSNYDMGLPTSPFPIGTR
ncbi:glutathione S-transferase [Jannaschia pohangensis]|uniref:Glutathione S-transferase n=1 Tax=Jannaschia pohangensis TaxID=390807 RepID=A0A1I3QTM3_9RHOB|nr:glutathione S-transferase [Jannaschia pohangensis]SFJ36457.1 glutathione S-transferase [Jannaschia pohangensis]